MNRIIKVKVCSLKFKENCCNWLCRGRGVRLMLLAVMLFGGMTAKATDYVFMYNGGYLAVDNSGNIIYTTTLSSQCVWTCVSSTSTLAGIDLSTTSRYLYTTVGDQKYWLVGSTTDGAAITTTTSAPGTAYWRNNNNRLYYRNGNDYYVYYRENTWRTSRRNNGNSYGVNAYMSGNNSGTDYRSTTAQVTITTVASTSTNPTISGADVLTATGNSNYTASGAAFRIGYTNYRFSNTDHYYDAEGNSFNGTPAAATISSYSWELSSEDHATVSGTTATGTVTVTSLPQSDVTLTLTVTATATGGTPAAPANTTLTNSKQITIQGAKPLAPIISVSGNTVTLSTEAVGSTTIRYTLDGTDPTALTGTVYSSAIDLLANGTSPVTIKAVTVRSGNASDVSEETVTLTLAAPTITADGAAGTATITAAAGTTIYYTTDGSTPTASSTQYTSSLSGLTPMTNIKAIAVKDGWNDSPVSSETLRIPSGADGTTVTLFDLEDHSWSYYSDPDCPIRSLSPADVKITYYGDGIMMKGDADYTANTSANDYITSSSSSDYVGGAKVNVGGEDENTFVYYKTLERGANTQTAYTFSSSSQSAAESRCPYTTIYNPFQVRPTYTGDANSNTADWSGWRGFQCWRLKSVSGGAVYSAASGGDALAVGAVINAETEIYFAPNSEYGMEVAFEAVWARAYVVKAGNGATAVGDHSSLGYERNFVVLNTTNASYNFGDGGTGKRITNINRQVTVTRYLPNGVRGQNNDATYVRGANGTNMTLQANTKFENVVIYDMSSYTINAAGNDLIIGRGCSGTIKQVNGSTGTGNLSHSIRIESGTITGLHPTNNAAQTYTGTLSVKCTIGCDYDRANEDNGKLSIAPTNTLIEGGGSTNVFSSANNRNNITYDWYVKSGKIQSNTSVNTGDPFYLGHYSNAENGPQYMGKRRLTIEGGELGTVACGCDNYGTTGNTTYASYGVNDGSWTVKVRMTGGTIKGSLYGAAVYTGASGDRLIVLTGGTVKGWVAGGCNGTRTDGGELYGSTYIYAGGNFECNSGNNETQIGSSRGGFIFGAGSGNSGATGDNASVGRVNSSTIAIADNAEIERGVYGGGNYGYVRTGTGNKSDIYVLGGTVNGSVFGGSNQQRGQIVNITMKGGTVTGGVYGGSNTSGTVAGPVTMNISGGTVETGVFGGGYGTADNSCDITGTVGITMTGGTVLTGIYGGGNVNSKIGGTVTININGGQVGEQGHNANVHGGGLGNLTRTRNSVTVNVGSRTDCNVSGTAVIYGDVYGGSAQGKTNGNSARENNAVTNVTFNKGTINGSLYGGGLGNATYAADVYGPVAVKVYGGTLTGGVYGANNVKGAPQSSVTVDIYGTDPQPAEGYAIANVYGGGNQAAYANANYPTVTIHDHNNVASKMSIGNVYGGGNAAAVTNTKVTVFGGDRIGAVYAGGNGTGVGTTFKMVTGNANAYICGGTIERVFAGNNSSGIVNGTKYVRINADSTEAADAANCVSGTHRPMKIGAVFHGGNQAAGSPGTVRIVCTGTTTAEYIDTLFGGANNADIVNNDMSTAADVTLNIDRGHIRTGIFGGNNSGGMVTGDITINLTRNSGGTCAFNYPTVFGGGYGEGTSTGGDIEINIGEKTSTATAPTVVATIEGGAVYGGSALGSVNDASNETTTINIYNGTFTGNIYGGGLGEAGNASKGWVNGDVTVNIGTSDQTDANCASDLTACSVFGCNNTNGSPQGNVTVHVYRTGHNTTNEASYLENDGINGAPTYAIDQVFGGGNLADYRPQNDLSSSEKKASVYIHGCDNTIRRVFGGGNAAYATGIATTIDGGRFDDVFGGGNGESGTPADVGLGGTDGNSITVHAGYINRLFGGSNENGSISGAMNVTVEKTGSCNEHIGEFFGGGNLAVLGDADHPVTLNTTIKCNTIFSSIYGGSNLAHIYGDVTLTIEGGTIDEVYGGSKGSAGTAANIYGNVKLNIYGGTIGRSGVIGRAFGGSNVNGNITGTIGVDLDWSQSTCGGKHIDYIYGGSNDASYTPTAPAATGANFSPVVKLINGTVSQNVYGGGRGTTATVTASPKVIVGDATNAANKATVNGDVFGGGDAADVNGRTNVIVGHTSTVLGNVFGGGNAAAIKKVNGNYGNTLVILKDKARVYKNVYGGGNQGVIESDTKVVVNGN